MYYIGTFNGPYSQPVRLCYLDNELKTNVFIYSLLTSSYPNLDSHYVRAFFTINNNVLLWSRSNSSSKTDYNLVFNLDTKTMTKITVDNTDWQYISYNQRIDDTKILYSKEVASNSKKLEFFTYDFQTSFDKPLKTTLFSMDDGTGVGYSFKACFLFEGYIYALFKDYSRTMRVIKFDLSVGTYTEVSNIEMSDNDDITSVFFSNGVMYFLGCYEYYAGAGTWEYNINPFVTKGYSIKENRFIYEDELGVGILPESEEFVLFNNDNSDTAYYATTKMIDAARRFTHFFLYETPYRTLPSIKGATYNLNKDAYVNGILKPANRDFVLDDNSAIKFDISVDKVSGVMKIPSQEI